MVIMYIIADKISVQLMKKGFANISFAIKENHRVSITGSSGYGKLLLLIVILETVGLANRGNKPTDF